MTDAFLILVAGVFAYISLTLCAGAVLLWMEMGTSLRDARKKGCSHDRA